MGEQTTGRSVLSEQHGGFFGQGEPNTAFARYFTGNSYLKPLTDPGQTVFIANVTFEPGCRNHWHIHHAKSGGGQILICVDGEGWYQEDGKPARSLKPGDVVTEGDKVDVKITDVDMENQKISLSIRALLEEPADEEEAPAEE